MRPRKLKQPRRHNKFFRLALFLISCIAIVVMTRHAIVGLAAEWILHRVYPEESGVIAGFSTARWNGATLSITGLEVDTRDKRLQIERIELVLGLKPHLWVIRPSCLFKNNEQQKQKPFDPKLALLRFVRFDLVEGRCAWEDLLSQADQEKFYFSVESEERPCTHLKFYEQIEDTQKPFNEVVISWDKDFLYLDVEGRKVRTEQLFTLLRFISTKSSPTWDELKGEWDLYLHSIIDKKGEVLSLRGNISASDVVIESLSRGWQFEASDLELVMSTPEEQEKRTWYRSIEVEAAIAGGVVDFHDDAKAYRFFDLGGHLSWQSKSDPKFHLEGSILLGDDYERVLLQGEGQIEDDGGFWFNSQLQLGQKEKAIALANFWVVSGEEDHLIIDAELQHAELPFLKHLADMTGITSPAIFTCSEGEMIGSCKLILDRKNLIQIELNPTIIKNTAFKKEGELYVEDLSLQAEGKWHYSSVNGWGAKQFECAVYSGKLDLFHEKKQFVMSGIAGELLVRDGEIEQSSLRAFGADIPFEFVLHGDWKRPHAKIFANTTWPAFLSATQSLSTSIDPTRATNEILDFWCALEPRSSGYDASIMLSSSKEGRIEAHFQCVDRQIKAGVIQIVKFPLVTCFASFVKDIEGRGVLDLEGRFNSQGGEALFSLKDFDLQAKDWMFGMPPSSTGQVSWGAKGEDLEIELPLRCCYCKMEDPLINLEDLSGDFVVSENGITLKNIAANCGGISFTGEASFSDKKTVITSYAITGTIEALRHLVQHNSQFPQVPPEWQGQFSMGKNDFRLVLPEKSLMLCSKIEQGKIPLDSLGVIDQLTSNIVYDSTIGEIKTGTLQGFFHNGDEGTPFYFEMAPTTFSMNKKEGGRGNINVLLKKDEEEILHLVGHLHQQDGETQLEIRGQDSHFLGVPLKKGSFSHLKNQEKFLIDDLILGDCSGNCELFLNNKKGVPFRYNLKHPLVASSGEGFFHQEKGILELTPSFDIFLKKRKPLSLISTAPIDVDYRSLEFKGGKWKEALTSSSIEIPRMIWNSDNGGLESELVIFNITEKFLSSWSQDIQLPSGYLKGSGSIKKISEGYEIVGILNDGEYGYNSTPLKLDHIAWRYTAQAMLIGARTQIGDSKVIGSFQWNPNDSLSMLKIQEVGQEKALSLFFVSREKGPALLQKISGELLGIKADMKNISREETLLHGKIDLDFEKISHVFSSKKELWDALKVGKGFAFEGDVAFDSLERFRAQGTFKGTQFTLFDYELNSFESTIVISPGRFQCKDAYLTDEAFSLSIPQINLSKNEDQQWMVNCPLLQIRDLQPSKLHKIGEKEKVLKPFTIRNLSFIDLYGDLEQPESFSGACSLHFTNVWKKEGNFLDIPLNLLKDLGLEPSLLVPVQGELEGHLQNGKLLFTHLKGAYSEGNRTQFALALSEKGSYIDFTGKLHIDLMMRQTVLLKIAESMTLGIRGDLNKPRYILIP